MNKIILRISYNMWSIMTFKYPLLLRGLDNEMETTARTNDSEHWSSFLLTYVCLDVRVNFDPWTQSILNDQTKYSCSQRYRSSSLLNIFQGMTLPVTEPSTIHWTTATNSMATTLSLHQSPSYYMPRNSCNISMVDNIVKTIHIDETHIW